MTNPVIYTSECLSTDRATASVSASLHAALDKLKVGHRVLANANDYWIRDFMPVCLSADGTYARYEYRPDYLWDDEDKRRYITRQSDACDGLDLFAPNDMNIIFDGGNYVRCGNKVVMTDKVLMENPRWHLDELFRHLTDTLCADIVLLPWDMEDEYGHSDGMLTYLGEERVLLNNYRQEIRGREDKDYYLRLTKILEAHFDIVELSYDCELDPDSWCYLNYLELPEAILLPCLSEQVDCDNDMAAKETFTRLFPRKEIVQIYAKPLIRRGGALHCATWEYYHKDCS